MTDPLTTELIFEAEAGVKIVQRFDGGPNEYELVMPSGNRNIWFTDREAAIYCAQVVGSCWLEAEACGAMEEREAAANPSPSEEGVRLTGEFVAKRNPDGEIEHHFNGEGDAGVLFAATPEAIPLTGSVEILIRPLSEGEANG